MNERTSPVIKLKWTEREEIETSAAQRIIQHHHNAINAAVNTVREAAKAGDLLVKEGEDRKGSFSKWVEDEMPFARKTAYQYIKIAKNVTAGLINLEEATSIRDALRLCNKAEGKEEEPKRAKDKRVETIPSLCTKIETAFSAATKEKAVKGWSSDEVDALCRTLQPIVDIWSDLRREE